MGNYTEAISSHEKVLNILKKTLPPNHQDLAAPYNNIGSSYYHMDDYSKALPFYQHALEIGERSLPENYPMLQMLKENIEKVEKELVF